MGKLNLLLAENRQSIAQKDMKNANAKLLRSMRSSYEAGHVLNSVAPSATETRLLFRLQGTGNLLFFTYCQRCSLANCSPSKGAQI